MGKIIAGPIMAGNEVIQLFRAERDFLSSISIRVATYERRLACKLSFSLFRLTGSSADPGNLKHLATATESASRIEDNSFFDLCFQPDYASKGHLYLLKVFSDDGSLTDAATVWLEKDVDRIAGHVDCFVNGRPQDGYGLLGTLGYAPPTPNTAVPELLIYSPVTQCNLNCVHCISRESRAHKERLPGHVREQIKTWCRRGLVKKICTDYSGDILWADERWPGELDFVIGLDVPLHVDTNGVCLTEARSRKLLNSRLAWLNVSLDAAFPKTYARVRKGSPPLKTVLDKVRTFAALRTQLGAASRVDLSLGFTLMASTLDELPAFLKLAAETGVHTVACRHIEAYTEDMAQESLWNDKARYNRARSQALRLADALGITALLPEPFSGVEASPGHRPCLAPWSMAILLGNGDVQVCCLPRTKIGNLNEQSMEDIWSGKPYADFRLAVNSDKPAPACLACGYARKPGNRASYLPYETMASWISPYDEARRPVTAPHCP